MTSNELTENKQKEKKRSVGWEKDGIPFDEPYKIHIDGWFLLCNQGTCQSQDKNVITILFTKSFKYILSYNSLRRSCSNLAAHTMWEKRI